MNRGPLKLTFFFLVSAALHSSILLLPDPGPNRGTGRVIPITLVVRQREEDKGAAPPRKEAVSGAEINNAPSEHLPLRPRTQPARRKRPGRAPMSRPPAAPMLVSQGPARETSEVKSERSKKTTEPTRRGAESSHLNGEERMKEPVESAHPPIPADVAETFSLEESAEDFIEEPIPRMARIQPLLNTKAASGNGSPTRAEAVSSLNESQRTLVVSARYAHIAKPEYPAEARKNGWEGTTVLRVLVDRRGKSAAIKLSRSSGFKILDQAAFNAVRSWRFRPARYGEKTVESWVKIPIVFRLAGRDRRAPP